ncbi:putative N-alpha-acetyltransferase 20 [Blattamonas nauphoetae]|uniref:N-alpha-acetyltransferase 20 n=1 Tax=Blattamonas nauphoetae TaxID=2049346 RepID=A0ABQ9XDY1_9EUKA|nr:putative N-alpha-acetyltransferase 20 [Blattamonas nauphoetae]
MDPRDLFKFNLVNLDVYTETYDISFYFEYLARWPEYCVVQENPQEQIVSYHIGKAEGVADNWHGHVTAVSVSPFYRRLHLGDSLMKHVERVSEIDDCYFVDLFVRVSNKYEVSLIKRHGEKIHDSHRSFLQKGETRLSHKLAYFVVYSPIIGKHDPDEEKILSFYPLDTHINEQLNFCGFFDALVNFSTSFSNKSVENVNLFT